MAPADRYRRQARECREQAALLSSEREKATWLKLAEEWDRKAEEANGIQGGQFAEQPGVMPPEKRRNSN
jgi:hypothetical protein